MAKNARIIKLDENFLDKNHLNVLSTKDAQQNERRRAALGELGNKVNANTNADIKENLTKDSKVPGFKHIKARVDCHWRKPMLKNLPNNIPNKPIEKTGNFVKQTITIKETVERIKVEKKSTLQRVLSVNEKKSFLPKVEINTNVNVPVSLVVAKKVTKDSTEKVKEIERIPEQNYVIESHSSKLLNQIEDIDRYDDLNPYLVSEYVDDIYKHLYNMELRFSVTENHLANSTEITPRMRSVLIDWVNEIHHQFVMVAETFYMTVAIIDRYLQANHNTKRKELQLVGVAALFTASKYEEMYPTEINDFVFITDFTYDKKQILKMEKEIVRTLDFQFGRPLAIHFLRRYSKAANADGHIHLMAKYFMELTSIEYKMSHYRPSEIAGSSLLLALMILSNTYIWNSLPSIWTNTLQYYTTYSYIQLKPLVKMIAQLVKKAPTGKLKAVYKKYSSSKFERVSTKTESLGSLLDKICQN